LARCAALIEVSNRRAARRRRRGLRPELDQTACASCSPHRGQRAWFAAHLLRPLGNLSWLARVAAAGMGSAIARTLDIVDSVTIKATLTAPSTADTYYYGACVDAVADEPDATDNCSQAMRVIVTE
jgi:hypothetical protein